MHGGQSYFLTSLPHSPLPFLHSLQTFCSNMVHHSQSQKNTIVLQSNCYVGVSLADLTLEKAFLDSGKLDLGLVSVSSNGIEP